MIRLLQFLWFGHWHSWETTESGSLRFIDTGEVGRRYILRCKTCGMIKKVDCT